MEVAEENGFHHLEADKWTKMSLKTIEDKKVSPSYLLVYVFIYNSSKGSRVA
jgi:hypothetical protein